MRFSFWIGKDMTSFPLNASITSDMFDQSFGFDVEEKLKLFADSGFRFIHWCDDWDNGRLYTRAEAEDFRDLIESCGLKCLDVHGSETRVVQISAEDEAALDRYIELLRNRIEFCSVVGGDAVVVHPPTVENGSRPLGWKLERSARAIDEVRKLCEDLDVVLAVENCYPYDEEMLEFYLERYPSDFIGFCFDSGHANLNKNTAMLSKYGNRLRALHLHDNKGIEDDHQPPLWGTVDWRSVIAWIEQSGYRKPWNFEIMHRPQLFKGSEQEFLGFTVESIQKIMSMIGTWSL